LVVHGFLTGKFPAGFMIERKNHYRLPDISGFICSTASPVTAGEKYGEGAETIRQDFR
jgi:hypothetical protein